ncbi:MAG: zinc-dependent alcohol dehydrogenase family protein [Pseudomonadota bacterium]
MNKLKLTAAFSLSFLFVSTSLFAEHDDSADHATDSSFLYVELNEMGDPAEVLEVKQGVAKELAEGEVRVEVLAAPIHPSNLLQIAGNYLTPPVLPSTPGSEGVGRVMEVSEGVEGLEQGQLVLLAGMGTWREQIVTSAARLIPLPNMGDLGMEAIEQLSMSTINPLTAFLMLSSYADLQEGDWVVQSASNSAVGGYLIQLAKQRGIKTVNIVRREGLEDMLKAKGADVVLIDGPDLAGEIAEATSGGNVALAVDAVGGVTYERLTQSLSEGGTIVSYGLLSGQQPTLNVSLTIGKDIRARGFWLSKWFQTSDAATRQATLGQIIPLIASGALKADIDSRFGVAEIKAAATRAGERGRNGKVLIVPTK